MRPRKILPGRTRNLQLIGNTKEIREGDGIKSFFSSAWNRLKSTIKPKNGMPPKFQIPNNPNVIKETRSQEYNAINRETREPHKYKTVGQTNTSYFPKPLPQLIGKSWSPANNDFYLQNELKQPGSNLNKMSANAKRQGGLWQKLFNKKPSGPLPPGTTLDNSNYNKGINAGVSQNMTANTSANTIPDVSMQALPSRKNSTLSSANTTHHSLPNNPKPPLATTTGLPAQGPSNVPDFGIHTVATQEQQQRAMNLFGQPSSTPRVVNESIALPSLEKAQQKALNNSTVTPKEPKDTSKRSRSTSLNAPITPNTSFQSVANSSINETKFKPKRASTPKPTAAEKSVAVNNDMGLDSFSININNTPPNKTAATKPPKKTTSLIGKQESNAGPVKKVRKARLNLSTLGYGSGIKKKTKKVNFV